MPSVSRHTARLGLLAVCASLFAGATGGCSTTQEKAAIQQARAKRILETRDDRKKKRADARRNESEKR